MRSNLSEGVFKICPSGQRENRIQKLHHFVQYKALIVPLKALSELVTLHAMKKSSEYGNFLVALYIHSDVI
jgi:hypothetical protein